MKQDLSDMGLNLYSLSKKIEKHHKDFAVKYPEISKSLSDGKLTQANSISQLLLNELSSFKFFKR